MKYSPPKSWPPNDDGAASVERATESVDAHDYRGRRQLSVEEFARHLCYPLYAKELDLPALERGCNEAVELGLAAAVCRPEHVGAAAKQLQGTEVATVTGLGFRRPSATPLTQQDLFDEASLLVEQGASELSVIANAQRLRKDPDGSAPAFVSALVALAARQHELQFRLRVHVEVRDLDEEQVRFLCVLLADAGVWMVQAGSWEEPRVSYRQLLPMREALGRKTLLKWTTPVRSVRVMLLAMSYGVNRFNAEHVAEFLDEAKRQAEVAPLAVPVPGLDY